MSAGYDSIWVKQYYLSQIAHLIFSVPALSFLHFDTESHRFGRYMTTVFINRREQNLRTSVKLRAAFYYHHPKIIISLK